MSNLGGDFNGQSALRYGNSLVGGEVSTKRAILRRAFRNNKVKKNGTTLGNKTSGPFRSAFSLGDPLSRYNRSYGAVNQVNSTNKGLVGVKLADGASNKDAGFTVSMGGEDLTPKEVPLESGNGRYVSDSSLYTRFKHLEGVNKNYNDNSHGGDKYHSNFSVLNRVRK